MSEDPLVINGSVAAATRAGIKASGNPDLALIAFPSGAQWSAVTTRHQLRAAPVRYVERLLRADPRRPLRGILVNAGNANACTGARGERSATAMARAAAIALGCDADEIAIASTGVIGVPLPDHKIRASLPELVRELAADGWTAAATAICTTDRAPKIASRRIKVADADVTVGGIAKGAGMIAPSMATMLAFVATDAHADAPTLDQIVRSAASETFNRIIVDGDRSTNDTLIVVATGAASADASDPVVRGALTTAVTDVCRDLALKIVRDGEGARRIAEITVEGARNAADAEVLARAVGHSNLFKTALYGGDPNWGRIAAAVGSREIAVLEETLEIEIAGVPMFHRGKVADAAARARAAAAMQAPVVPVRVRIGRGPGAATVWASDLGHEYVTCNADYTT